MKKILISLFVIGVVSVATIGATRAYFSDKAEVLGNTMATGYMQIAWDRNRSVWGNSMYFPLELIPGEDTSWVDPNGTHHDQRIKLELAEGSIVPDHFEIQFSTSNFRSGHHDGYGSESWKRQYTRVIEVTKLYNHTDDWQHHGLLSQVDDTCDGNVGFVSLYDLEECSLIDNVAVGEELNSIGFVLKMDDNADNKFQGDSLDLEVTVGAAQVADQSVL